MTKEHKSKEPNIDYQAYFKAELVNIDKLEQTPNLIKVVAVQTLELAINTPNIPTTIKNSLENSKRSLENINDRSIEDNFKAIYAQMCILAVSSLESVLKKYFENALNGFNGIKWDNEELKGIKITLSELAANRLSYRSEFGSLVLEKAKLNFQDLQAIKRNFENYLSKKVSLDEEIQKKICFYLESRHVLVHKGGFVDKKFLDAVTSFRANIKNYKEGDKIEIGSSDWSEIKSCFIKLVEDVSKYIP